MSAEDQALDVVKSLVGLRRSWQSGLPASQVHILLHLAEKGPLTMTELAGDLRVPCSTATETIDRLVFQGWVERVPDPKDRRRVQVRLTTVALDAVQTALDQKRREVLTVLDQLDEGERTGLVRGLRLLGRALSAGAGVCVYAGNLIPQEAPALLLAL